MTGRILVYITFMIVAYIWSMIMSSLLDIPFQKLVDGRFSADGMDLDAILRRACRSIGSFCFFVGWSILLRRAGARAASWHMYRTCRSTLSF